MRTPFLRLNGLNVVLEVLEAASKNIGDRTAFNTENQHRTALRHVAAPRAMHAQQNTIWQLWEKQRTKAANDLIRITTIKGQKARQRAGQRWIDQWATRAYQYGMRAAGIGDMPLGEEDQRWLETYFDIEWRFLAKFFAALQADAVSDARRLLRARAFSQTLDSVFYVALISAFPAKGTTIYWHLGGGEHCSDCLVLARTQRYTPDTLPTTPRAGSTRCMANCKCKLVVRFNSKVYLKKADTELISAHAEAIETDDLLIQTHGIEPESPIGLLLHEKSIS